MRMLIEQFKDLPFEDVVRDCEFFKKEDFLPIDYLYLNLFKDKNEVLLDSCADLITLHKNMRCYSRMLEPYYYYFTPQDGEYEIHNNYHTHKR